MPPTIPQNLNVLFNNVLKPTHFPLAPNILRVLIRRTGNAFKFKIRVERWSKSFKIGCSH